MQIATDEDSGVLLYKGDNDHIAMELYRGRLRVSYDTGSYPPSAIYRYTHTRTHTHTHTHTQTHTHTHRNIYRHAHTHTYACENLCRVTHTHTFITL